MAERITRREFGCEGALAGVIEQVRDRGYAEVNVYFTIAMSRLAAGDRPGAVDYLQKCTNRVVAGNFSYEVARAFLHRMRSDANWPRWLMDRGTESPLTQSGEPG